MLDGEGECPLSPISGGGHFYIHNLKEVIMHPLNRKYLFTRARNRKSSGSFGYIVMFETQKNNFGFHVMARPDEAQFFNIWQDEFCKTMDTIYNKRRTMWGRVRPVRIAFMTYFEDPRLTNEYHALYFHWWKTNEFKHFCNKYVALKLQ